MDNANPTCPFPSEIPTLYNGQARHGGHRKTLVVMTSAFHLRSHNSVASLLAVLPYQIVVNYLLDRKVEYVGHMDSTITWSMNAHN